MLIDATPSPPSRYERQLQQKLREADRLAGLTADGRDLFLRLCTLRRRLAKDANIPAYQVLGNQVLLTLCEQRPSDLLALMAIPGLGQGRLKAYGAEVLAVLRWAPAGPSQATEVALGSGRLTALGE